MELSKRQIAHVLSALRFCQGKDLGGMCQFDEAQPLTGAGIDGLCEALNCAQAAEPLAATEDSQHYTVIALFPDSEWDCSMWDASFVEHISAPSPERAAWEACRQAAGRRLIGKDANDGVAKNEEIQEMAGNIEVLAVFQGHLMDVHDRDKYLAD